MYKKYFIIAGKILICIFALIGLAMTIVFFGMQFGIFNVRGSSKERNSFFKSPETEKIKVIPCITADKVCNWDQTPEWVVVESGLIKDKDIINRVANETGVSARLIIATVAPEQLRFFTANRESFKKYFEPLKILGSMTKFSLGISGVKQDTAVAIENHIKYTSSPFYPLKDMRALIAYTPEEQKNKDAALYNRLTDSKNHYYSYLYTALFLKQVQAHWESRGFAAQATPGVLITIFNTGFGNSKPNASPIVGGAPLTVGGKTYLFGELGQEIYTSETLTSYFPK